MKARWRRRPRRGCGSAACPAQTPSPPAPCTLFASACCASTTAAWATCAHPPCCTAPATQPAWWRSASSEGLCSLHTARHAVCVFMQASCRTFLLCCMAGLGSRAALSCWGRAARLTAHSPAPNPLPPFLHRQACQTGGAAGGGALGQGGVCGSWPRHLPCHCSPREAPALGRGSLPSPSRPAPPSRAPRSRPQCFIRTCALLLQVCVWLRLPITQTSWQGVLDHLWEQGGQLRAMVAE